jgi:hypothetical protein
MANGGCMARVRGSWLITSSKSTFHGPSGETPYLASRPYIQRRARTGNCQIWNLLIFRILRLSVRFTTNCVVTRNASHEYPSQLSWMVARQMIQINDDTRFASQ